MRVLNQDLNLYILKRLPLRPTLSGVSAKTGPLESNLIAIATKSITGEKITIKKEERTTSINRFKIS
jgi:hypothetical protein